MVFLSGFQETQGVMTDTAGEILACSDIDKHIVRRLQTIAAGSLRTNEAKRCIRR